MSDSLFLSVIMIFLNAETFIGKAMERSLVRHARIGSILSRRRVLTRAAESHGDSTKAPC